MRHADKTECPQGHPYDEANTIRLHVKGTDRFKRQCRICKREQSTTSHENMRRKNRVIRARFRCE